MLGGVVLCCVGCIIVCRVSDCRVGVSQRLLLRKQCHTFDGVRVWTDSIQSVRGV